MRINIDENEPYLSSIRAKCVEKINQEYGVSIPSKSDKLRFVLMINQMPIAVTKEEEDMPIKEFIASVGSLE